MQNQIRTHLTKNWCAPFTVLGNELMLILNKSIGILAEMGVYVCVLVCARFKL